MLLSIFFSKVRHGLAELKSKVSRVYYKRVPISSLDPSAFTVVETLEQQESKSFTQ